MSKFADFFLLISHFFSTSTFSMVQILYILFLGWKQTYFGKNIFVYKSNDSHISQDKNISKGLEVRW